MKRIILSLLFVFISHSAWAQSSFTFKDAGGSAQTAKSFNCSGNICSMAVPADSTGTALPGLPGWTPKVLSSLNATVQSVKASAGQLGELKCSNTNVAQAYVQVFNIASGSVSLGTSVPLLSIPVPAAAVGGIGPYPLAGIAFSTAISVAATTTAGGLTAPNTALDCNASFN